MSEPTEFRLRLKNQDMLLILKLLQKEFQTFLNGTKLGSLLGTKHRIVREKIEPYSDLTFRIVNPRAGRYWNKIYFYDKKECLEDLESLVQEIGTKIKILKQVPNSTG